MKYFSLNKEANNVDFSEAVVRGLAPDNGLYFPQKIEALPKSFFDNITNLSNHEIAFQAIKQFASEAIPENDLRAIVEDTLSLQPATRTVERIIEAAKEQQLMPTTEGGLDLKKNKNKIKKIISQFKKKKIRTSLFVNPNIKDIYLSKEIGADCIEIHTGHFSNLIKSKKSFIKEFLKIKKCAILASKIGVEVHAGHGLDFKSTKILTKINEIVEFNIGHFIIGESIFYGLPFVIKKFKRIIKN